MSRNGRAHSKTTPPTAWLVGGQGYTTGNAMDGSRYKHRVWPVRGGVLAPPKPADAQMPEKK